METRDVIVVGGGPGGSSAARALVRAGARVLVVDRARFPRVKLCAGWISRPIWDALELSPRDYPAGLWPWERCHVHFGGHHYAFRARGHFIRRAELDHFLLERSGAEVEQAQVKKIEGGPGDWLVVTSAGERRARFLVGAGGTHCPVARQLFAAKPRRPVGVKEREFPCDAAAVARTRLGADGEPELLLHDDLRGYSWNVPKTDWLNVGCGTVDAKQVREAWGEARSFFVDSGHLPDDAADELERVKGHSYYLFDPAHLDDCVRDGAALVGDALGLAHPLTAEGILPAVVSGRLAGEAVAAGDPASYARQLRGHPVIADYTVYYRLREAAGRLLPGGGEARRSPPGRLARWAAAKSFAWMFSGTPLPGSRVRAAMNRRTP